jgi:hypothetical protein
VSESDPAGNPEADRVPTPTPGRREAEHAALDAVEPERLLEGEDEHSAYADDALHWTQVYAEILDFKQSLLELAERRVAVTGDDAGAELRETDLKVLAAEAARFQHRLVFWQRRLREFESASVTNSE